MNQPNELLDDGQGKGPDLISSLSVDQLDGLFDSFRDFVLSAANTAEREGDRPGTSHAVPQVVSEFARRLSFLSKVEGHRLDYTRLADRLSVLTDAKMAEMAIADVDSEPSKQRLADYISSRPYPHYEPVAGNVDLVIQIQKDGTRRVGRFEGREFVAIQDD